MPWTPSPDELNIWTNGAFLVRVNPHGDGHVAVLRGPARNSTVAARIDAQNLMDLVDAHDETTPTEPDAAVHLAAVVSLLNALDAPKVVDARVLDPASRLAVYLDQVRTRIRMTAEDDAEEWGSLIRRERGLVEAVVALGNLLAAREGR